LRREGHEAEAVYRSRDGLERAAVFRPDIVLLDIGLPEIDGYEVARRLRSKPALSHMRLIAVTGYGQANDRERTLAAGFDDHLVKPVGVQELQRSIAGTSARDFSRSEVDAAPEA
jgi:CheY-like chemotaxis protein